MNSLSFWSSLLLSFELSKQVRKVSPSEIVSFAIPPFLIFVTNVSRSSPSVKSPLSSISLLSLYSSSYFYLVIHLCLTYLLNIVRMVNNIDFKLYWCSSCIDVQVLNTLEMLFWGSLQFFVRPKSRIAQEQCLLNQESWFKFSFHVFLLFKPTLCKKVVKIKVAEMLWLMLWAFYLNKQRFTLSKRVTVRAGSVESRVLIMRK